MSKATDLKEKYSRVTDTTYRKLLNGDNTPTKKYLEYMLKMWTSKVDRKQNIPSAEALVKEVNLFDTLLPYNPNKDIYSSEYSNFATLKAYNLKYWEVREEKTFVREEHANVIYEDDDILFVEPKTHKGSLRYGANTKWCTASKNNPSTFTSYTSRGCLAYLIDKNNSKGSTYSKLAFINQSGFPLSGQIEIYNQADSHISEKTIVSNGWDEMKIAELMLKYRTYHVEWEYIKQSRNEIGRLMNALKSIDLSKFDKHVQILNNFGESHLTKEAQNSINKFLAHMEENLSNLKK
jgi:hypothetical protein